MSEKRVGLTRSHLSCGPGLAAVRRNGAWMRWICDARFGRAGQANGRVAGEEDTANAGMARILTLWVCLFEAGRKINSLRITLQAGCDLQLSGSVRQRQKPPVQPIAVVTSARGPSGIVGCINGAIQPPPSRQIGSPTAPIVDCEPSLPDAHDSRYAGYTNSPKGGSIRCRVSF